MKIEGTKLYMVRGDTEYLSVICENYSLKEGDIVELTVRKTATDSKKIIYKKITEFEKGTAQIKIDPEDTAKLQFGEYKYDIQLTFGNNGDVKTIIPFSSFNIRPEVTYA